MSAKQRKTVRLRGTRIPTFGPDVVMVRVGQLRNVGSARRRDVARVMVRKAAKALQKPGLHKGTVFRKAARSGVFAYSVYEKDPTKFVREAPDGTRKVGRVVHGKFKAA
jgi:hypothetical protein